MNQNQQAFTDLFLQRMQENSLAFGENFVGFTLDSAFAFQEAAMRAAGVNALMISTRTIYGSGAGLLMIDSTAGAAGFAGGMVGTTIASYFLAAGATASIGAMAVFAAAAGFGGVAGSIIGQSAYEAYVEYQSQYDTAPNPEDVFPPEMDYVPGDEIVLPPINVDVDTDLAADHLALMRDLSSLLDQFNHNYNQWGINVDVDINDIMNKDYQDWMDYFDQVIGPDGIVPEAAGGTARMLLGKIVEKVLEIQEHYQNNKDLLDSLDPEMADSMAQLEEGLYRFLEAVLERATPLVLDLDGDGISTLSLVGHDAEFDFGFDDAVSHGWLSPDDGFLALDKNKNGSIDDHTELFGGRDMDGFSILAAFDDDENGIIDERDSVFSNLVVWQDRNSDGVSQEDELHSLGTLGIASISLDVELQHVTDSGNLVPLISSYSLTDGTERTIADVYFSYVAGPRSAEAVNIVSDSHVVQGSLGNDRLEGTAKDQLFIGSGGSDTFVFGETTGHDAIFDFDTDGPNADLIEIVGGPFKSFEALASRLYDQGGNTVIVLGDDSTITLYDVARANLNDANFVFAA